MKRIPFGGLKLGVAVGVDVGVGGVGDNEENPLRGIETQQIQEAPPTPLGGE
jgi:hypothetical protein